MNDSSVLAYESSVTNNKLFEYVNKVLQIVIIVSVFESGVTKKYYYFST